MMVLLDIELLDGRNCAVVQFEVRVKNRVRVFREVLVFDFEAAPENLTTNVVFDQGDVLREDIPDLWSRLDSLNLPPAVRQQVIEAVRGG